MKIESETTIVRPTTARAHLTAPSTSWISAAAAVKALERLDNATPRFVACAPGRLDVLGGLADYAGAQALLRPVDAHIYVCVQRCDEPKLFVYAEDAAGRNERAPLVVPMANLPSSKPASPTQIDELNQEGTPLTRCVLAAVIASLCHDKGMLPGSGIRVCVCSDLDRWSDVAGDAATVAATVSALSAASGIEMDIPVAIDRCRAALNDWLGSPRGVSDAICSLVGDGPTLSCVLSEPPAAVEPARLPEGVALGGVDCGVVHANAHARLVRARVATWMGRALIDRIVQYEKNKLVNWRGCLAHLSVENYVRHFRDRLPTKIKGGDFFDRFGETGDPATRIEKDFVYKVRSRTEHPIYENTRVRQFLECLSRAGQNSDERALVAAGDLMYASHWSYGQRCALASIETDLLVNLIRKQGARAGLFGARITGGGCGGVVVVLMKSDKVAQQALQQVMDAYREQTGNTPRALVGTSAGTLVRGVQRV